MKVSDIDLEAEGICDTDDLPRRYVELKTSAQRAAGELRHAYKVKQDWNLVARAIKILEEATTPQME